MRPPRPGSSKQPESRRQKSEPDNTVQLLQLTQDFPLALELEGASWRPARPGEIGHEAMIRMPGFAISYWMQIFDHCYSTIVAWRDAASTTQQEIEAAMCALTPADGLAMARARGACQMPFWSRLAIAHYRKHGISVRGIADSFLCSQRTVNYILTRTQFTNPQRQLTEFQKNPPSRRTRALIKPRF